MNRHSGKRNPPEHEENRDAGSFERRRIGQIVHDDRGSASVEWRDAPLDHERQKLEIEDERGSGRGDSKLRGGLSLEMHVDDTFNPYDRKPDTFAGKPGAPAGPKGAKRDLKKLSEWLKLMREMEERKKNGESGE
ncbi:MAG: hypothetical protein WDO68_14765 [Gammaproteobacteria bacterium]